MMFNLVFNISFIYFVLFYRSYVDCSRLLILLITSYYCWTTGEEQDCGALFQTEAELRGLHKEPV